MGKKELKHKTHILQIDERSADLCYYLLCRSPENISTDPPYGILIEKEMENAVVDTYSAEDCFFSSEEACSLLEGLALYQVTPISASECIEELLNNY
ncbi:MAG: DUF6514 family protein [Clostridia bacterium]